MHIDQNPPHVHFQPVVHAHTVEMPSPLESVAKGVKVKSKLVSWKSFSWVWVLFSLFLLVGNGILMIFLGLDLIGVGLSNPWVLLVWHFVLFLCFGVVTIISAVIFTQEELLEDGLRLPILSGLWSLYNGVAAVMFLAWVIAHPNLSSDVQFSDDPSAYSSFVAVNGVSFLWFWIGVMAIVICWVIHYNQRKYLETLERSLQVTDVILMTYHGTSLHDLMIELGGGTPGVDSPTEHESIAQSHFSGSGVWGGTSGVVSRRTTREPVRGTGYSTRVPPRRMGRQPQMRQRAQMPPRQEESFEEEEERQ